MQSDIQLHNLNTPSVWNSVAECYDEISRTIADAIEHAVERLQPQSGEHILDLATGSGWGSRVIAERFPDTKVTGVDIADQMLAQARSTATMRRLDIEYRLGDAESLPFGEASFDAVISTFGVMFVGSPEVAAKELARVVKPGGRLVLATWTSDSSMFHMFGLMRRFMPTPAVPRPLSPFAWGRRERMTELLDASFALKFEQGTNWLRYRSGEQAWKLWLNHYGPVKAIVADLDDGRREELKCEMIAWHESFDGQIGFDQPRQYLITVGIRR